MVKIERQKCLPNTATYITWETPDPAGIGDTCAAEAAALSVFCSKLGYSVLV